MKTYSGKNTAINNKWALKNFEDWFNARRESLSVEEKRQALEVLLTDDPSELCDTLILYVKQTRKVRVASPHEYHYRTQPTAFSRPCQYIRTAAGSHHICNPVYKYFLWLHHICDIVGSFDTPTQHNTIILILRTYNAA